MTPRLKERPLPRRDGSRRVDRHRSKLEGHTLTLPSERQRIDVHCGPILGDAGCRRAVNTAQNLGEHQLVGSEAR